MLEEARDDARRLERGLREVAAELVVRLHDNPYLGEALEPRAGELLDVLGDCRKIRFDAPGWRDKPRYRFVYRLEPHEGSVAKIVVLAIERHENLVAYLSAAARLARRLRVQARGTRR